MKSTFTLLIIVLFFLSGCAGVKFYSDPELTKRTGLVHYEPKPYLLIEYDSEKGDTPKNLKLIFLPDFTKPTYTKVINGLGANDVSLTLNNGILSNFGAKTDSKIPELITPLLGTLSEIIKNNTTQTNQAVESNSNKKEIICLYEIIIDSKGTSLRKATFIK